MTDQTPTHVVAPSIGLRHLDAGDRLTIGDKAVEVVGRVQQVGRDGYLHPYLRLRSLKTNRVLQRVHSTSGRHPNVELLTDRPRPEILDLSFWPGGSGGMREDWENPLVVPLSRGGGVLLAPAYSPAGVAINGTDQVTTAPTFYQMRALVPAAKVSGTMAVLTENSHRLWGEGQWTQLTRQMQVVGAVDGGLTPAGQALHDFGLDPANGYAADAWIQAVSAHTGRQLPLNARPVFLSLAHRWSGTLEQLFTTTEAALAT